MKKHLVITTAMLLSALCLATSPLQAQLVRLHGATTLAKLITDQKAALETQTGVKLEIVGNGAGRGLLDLAGGQADVAMLAGSLKGVAEAMNKEKPGSVDITGFKETPLTSMKLVFAINPAAGVKSVTEAQARDLCTGKITNWKEAGGADVPVKLVLAFAGDGARVSLQEQLLNGADFAKDAILRNSSKDIPPVLGQLPGSFSCLSEKNATGLTTVTCDKDIQMPMLLVTKGEPAGDAKKVTEAIKGAIK